MEGVSASQNWVDILGGARIHIPVSQKAMITVGGDAGGGGANSDYQSSGHPRLQNQQEMRSASGLALYRRELSEQ